MYICIQIYTYINIYVYINVYIHINAYLLRHIHETRDAIPGTTS